MNRSSLSFLALIVSLVCFVVALLITAGVLHGSDYHPWVDGGFVGLLTGLIVERQP